MYSGGMRGSQHNWPGVGSNPNLVIDASAFDLYFQSDGSAHDWGYEFAVIVDCGDDASSEKEVESKTGILNALLELNPSAPLHNFLSRDSAFGCTQTPLTPREWTVRRPIFQELLSRNRAGVAEMIEGKVPLQYAYLFNAPQDIIDSLIETAHEGSSFYFFLVL